jgi:hypothetical protein
VWEQGLFEIERLHRVLWLAHAPARRATRQPAYRLPALDAIIMSRAPPKRDPPRDALLPVRGRPPTPRTGPRPLMLLTTNVRLDRRASRLNSLARPSRRHPRSPSASLVPIKGSSPLPAHAHRPTGPPLTSPRRTRFPACFHCRPRPPSSALDTTQARTPAYSPALRRCSSDFEPRRSHRCGHATVARWSRLRPSNHRQSIHGESNRISVPRVDLPRPGIAAVKLAPPARARL